MEILQGIQLISRYLGEFQGLNNEIAESLVRKGYIKDVIKNLSSFSGINQINLVNKAIELGVDFAFIFENKDRFNQECKNYIGELREKFNYHMVDDIDGEPGKKRTVEDTIRRISQIIHDEPLPGGSKLITVDVKQLGGHSQFHDVGGFEVTVVGGEAGRDHKLTFVVDTSMPLVSYKIPGLKLGVKDRSEFLRIVNLLLFLKNNFPGGEYYHGKAGEGLYKAVGLFKKTVL